MATLNLPSGFCRRIMNNLPPSVDQQMQLYTINIDVTGILNHIVLPVHWWSPCVPGRIDFVSMTHAQDRHFIKRFANDLQRQR